MSLRIKELRRDTKAAQEYFSQYLAYTLGPIELQYKMENEDIQIIDVRRQEDYEIGHIKGALSIPKEELSENLEKISKEKISIVYAYNSQCHLGARSCLILAEYGYPCMLLEGGFKAWTEDFKFEIVN